MKSKLVTVSVGAALALTGCMNLSPDLPEASPQIPQSVSSLLSDSEAQSVVDTDWSGVITDPWLLVLVQESLVSNRDLKGAALQTRRLGQAYRISQANRKPSLAAEAGLSRSSIGGDISQEYDAHIGVASYELDVFGRLQNLSREAWLEFVASDYGRQAVALTLVSSVTDAYLDYVSSQQLLDLATSTMQARKSSLSLSIQRYKAGGVSALDISQERANLESARKDVSQYKWHVAQAKNALSLLVGNAALVDLVSTSDSLSVTGHDPLPGHIASDRLVSRPDIKQAEAKLRAANASIGAARAAYLPSISLTGSLGSISPDLSGLFSSGAESWSFIPKVTVPIFTGGKLDAQLAVAKTDQDLMLNSYEKTLQNAFYEVSNILSHNESLRGQMRAEHAMLMAAKQTHSLSTLRYQAGRDSYLTQLDADRTLYGAQKEYISTQVAYQKNRVALYVALGGGWIQN